MWGYAWRTDGACVVWQELEKLSRFLVVMVSNFPGGKSLPDIHNMLKMFLKDPPYDRTLEQLGAILGRLAAQERVSVCGGMYSVRRQ